jgi:Phage integrase family
MVSFHALRHTHASALIAAGLDVVVISRRLGHGSPHVTLRVYGHLFKRDDSADGERNGSDNKSEVRTVTAVIRAFRGQFVDNSPLFSNFAGAKSLIFGAGCRI